MRGQAISLICAIALIPTLWSAALAQSSAPSLTRIVVVDERPLDNVEPTRPHVEPYLAVNPTDPRHMVVGAILPSDPVFGASQDCAVFTTFDAGTRWVRKPLGVAACGDPWVEILADGSAIVAVLSGSRLLVFQSMDGGRTWDEKPSDLGTGHDHVTMASTAGASRAGGSLYAITGKLRRVQHGTRGAAFVGRSTDGGRSFPDTLTRVFTNLNFNVDDALVLSDSSLLIVMTDHMRNVMAGDGALDRSRTWVAQSVDGGREFSPLLFATEICGRAIGFPSAAVDRTDSPSRTRVYIACSSRSRTEIFVTRSLRGLDVWSEPVRVAGGNDSTTRRTTAVAVNSRGVVGVSWYQRIGDARPDCHRVMFAGSFDGGETFTTPVTVSSADSCVDTPLNGAAAKRWAMGGEYTGFVAAPDGSFRLVWADSRSGAYQLRMATVELRPTP